jgi:glucokinase
MFLGIEIGGTKLQLGVGQGDGGPLAEMVCAPAEAGGGAGEIRRQIAELGRELAARHSLEAIGIGFGGPVDGAEGRTITSHQVAGWNDFPLAAWSRETFGLPTAIGNDSDLAGLAEARFGAGRGRKIVFYSNVGSGIGGALVIDGEVYPGGSGIAAEIGHLRPEFSSDPACTVESRASGWAIAQRVRRALQGARQPGDDPDAAAFFARYGDDEIDTRMVAEAAAAGNALARAALGEACRVYGWALAQMITLLAPNVVVIGGGVAQVGEELFLGPLREQVGRFVFPPLAGTYEMVSARLGQEVVVYGALALAARCNRSRTARDGDRPVLSANG